MTETGSETATAPVKRDKTHFLYLAVIGAVIAGAIVGLVLPSFGESLKPLGTGFVALIKMMIGPIIFCTIVLGVGSIREAAKVGKVGGLALAYFLTMSTVALGVGLLVGNFLHPGSGLDLSGLEGSGAAAAGDAKEGTVDFVLGIIPTTLVSSLTEGEVLQALLVALLVGFAIQAMGPTGPHILRGVGYLQKLVFRILSMIMWLAPVGAFGAIAAVVGATGTDALISLARIMFAFYITCALFVFVILGSILRAVVGLNIFSLLGFMIIASKGAAGVTGAGLATLAGGLQSHRPDLVDGVGLIVGIDRFMSEARAVTNFAGNAVATILIGHWVGEFDKETALRTFRGENPFDEQSMLDDPHDAPAEPQPVVVP